MPKLAIRTSTWQEESTGGPTTASQLTLDGFIDAANYLAFERSLEQAYQEGQRFLILDFTDVHYINSTGISALIRYFDLYRQRGGTLCLANVAKPVGLSMHLLGVTSFLPFLKDLEAARSHVRDIAEGRSAVPAAVEGAAPEDGIGLPFSGATPRRIPLRRRRIPGLDQAKVLVITPAKNRFTRVLRLRFNSLNGDYHLLHDIHEALERYEHMAPDLVVVDERSDPRGEFVNRLKIQKDRSLTSVVKLYGKEKDVGSLIDFKIWENDYLVEPFEVLELFSLTEAELMRVPKDRKVFQQQVHFEFKTTPENIEKAYKLSDLILRQSVHIQEDATALYAGVKEGIDNAVVHGNRMDASKTINVNFLVDHKKITVIIEDEGKGFDYEYYTSRIDDEEAFEKAKRRILEEGARGGLGILLMSKCTDRLEYSGTGNVLRLEKNI
jgi:serine/threonine-protein kinase RsbW